MTKMTEHRKRPSAPSSKRDETAVLGATTPTGREVWYVISGGQRETVVTSVSSAAAMNEAVALYAGALKRLAKR